MNHPTPPNSGFILVVDRDGDIVENYPENSVIDVIFRRMELLDKEFPSDSPHSAWRGMIDEGEIPDVPGLDMGRAQHILVRFSEVKEKIEMILDGEPLKVSGESLQKIMDIIKEEGK